MTLYGDGDHDLDDIVGDVHAEMDEKKRRRRERIATAMMAAMLTSPRVPARDGREIQEADDWAKFTAPMAVMMADALIAELDKST